ncbi:MAG: Ntn hydrolase family protein [Planctomycetota bacterium]
MSTIVVVRKGSTACIAGDTLTKLGNTREPAEMMAGHDKITKIGSSYFGVVGHASCQMILESYFHRQKKKPSLTSASAIFEAMRTMHQGLKDHYYLNPQEEEDDPFESSQMDFLIANTSGIYGVYSLRSVQEYTKFYAFGSGYKFALGAMKAAYDELDSAEAIAQRGIETAAYFDDATGLPMTSYTIRLKR